jgi:hypothetical protein
MPPPQLVNRAVLDRHDATSGLDEDTCGSMTTAAYAYVARFGEGCLIVNIPYRTLGGAG